MRLKYFTVTLLLITITTFAFAQNTYLGTWKTVDDDTGKDKGLVEIYEEGGKLYGKIIKVLDPKRVDNKICTPCKGDKKDKPVIGLVILEGLYKKGNYYTGGYVTDPENGKEYKCYIELEGKDKLKVRGYVGVAALGRTQYWYRVK